MTRRPAFNRNDFEDEVDNEDEDNNDLADTSAKPSLLQRLFGRGTKNKRHDENDSYDDDDDSYDDDANQADSAEERWQDELESAPLAQQSGSQRFMRLVAVVLVLLAALIAGMYVWKPAVQVPTLTPSANLLGDTPMQAIDAATNAIAGATADAVNAAANGLPVPISPDFDLRRPTDPMAAQ